MQQHFGRPGNRFWPTIHKAGFTPRLFHPSEQRELLKHGCGITNVVARATTAAAELTSAELVEGALRSALSPTTEPQPVVPANTPSLLDSFSNPKPAGVKIVMLEDHPEGQEGDRR